MTGRPFVATSCEGRPARQGWDPYQFLSFGSPRSSVPSMKSLCAAILLLFQMQPLVGTAACLGLVNKPQQDCEMPEHEAMPPRGVEAQVPMTPASCPLATVCAPAPLAIPALPQQLVRFAALDAAPAIIFPDAPPELASAPPLPPPRA
jgi:hypothetical protein